MLEGHPHLLEAVEEVKELLSEDDILAASHHKRLERGFLHLRNVLVALATALFLASLFHAPQRNLLKAIAYFFGAGAYVCEIVLLTDCFSHAVPHREAFMAYCFGPMYILLGISYLLN